MKLPYPEGLWRVLFWPSISRNVYTTRTQVDFLDFFAMSSECVCHSFCLGNKMMGFSPQRTVVISGSKFYPAALGAIQAATCCHSHVDLEPSPRDRWPWMRRCPCGRVGSGSCHFTIESPRALRLWKFEWWQWTWRIDIVQNLDSVWSGEALLFSIHSNCTRKINLQGVKPFKTPQTSETSWYLESLRTCWFSKFGDWIPFFAQLIQKSLNFLDGQQPISLPKGSKEFENCGMNLIYRCFSVCGGRW